MFVADFVCYRFIMLEDPSVSHKFVMVTPSVGTKMIFRIFALKEMIIRVSEPLLSAGNYHFSSLTSDVHLFMLIFILRGIGVDIIRSPRLR